MQRKHPDGGAPAVPKSQIASGSAPTTSIARVAKVKVKAAPRPPKPPRPPRPPYVRPPKKPVIRTQEEVDKAVQEGFKVAYSLNGKLLIYDIECPDCDKMYASKSSLRQHRDAQHPTDAQLSRVEAKCSRCESHFDHAISLNDHLMRCLPTHDLKDFSCCHCDTSWYSASALKKHIAEQHRLVTNICHICGSIIKCKSFLKEHLVQVHGGKKDYQCYDCGKAFASKLGLTSHYQNVSSISS